MSDAVVRKKIECYGYMDICMVEEVLTRRVLGTDIDGRSIRGGGAFIRLDLLKVS